MAIMSTQIHVFIANFDIDCVNGRNASILYATDKYATKWCKRTKASNESETYLCTTI